METAAALPSPDTDAIRKHLQFLISGMKEYSDGRLEIAYTDEKEVLRNAQNFDVQEIETMVAFAADLNQRGRNIYIVGSFLDPDTPPYGRSRDADFYSCNSVWCDIDRVSTAEEIKSSYKSLPPSLIVVTGRAPHVRTHLWWKLKEPITDSERLREVLAGLQQNLGGDPAVKNVTSLMRLAGTVNWQTAKKRAAGRTVELTELKTPAGANKSVTVDQLLAAYAPKEFIPDTTKYTPAPGAQGGIAGTLLDGREGYMHQMLAAAIFNLSLTLNRWPTPDEVFQDAWPVYSAKVTPRGGRTLEQDGRGQQAMRQKIVSKLRAFAGGQVQGYETLALVRAAAAEHAPPRPPAAPQLVQSALNTNDWDKPQNINNLQYQIASDVKSIIDVQDFVEETLRDGEMSVIYGRPNVGKTFMAIDLALRVALGMEWLGKQVEGGPAVYFALEGGHGAKNRIVAFRQHHQVSGDILLAVIGQGVAVATPDGHETIKNTITEITGKIGKPRLIVVDTLARAMAGLDENSTKDMSLFIRYIDALREITGAHICIIHHTGKDVARGARGSSALLGGIDTEIELSREEDSDIVQVAITKQREMEKGKDLFYKLRGVTLGTNRRGKEVTSCVVIPAEEEHTIKNPVFDLPRSLKPVIDVLKNVFIDSGYRIFGQHGFPPSVKVIHEEKFSEALRISGMLPDTERGAKSTYYRWRKMLIDSNVIRIYDGRIWIVNGENRLSNENEK